MDHFLKVIEKVDAKMRKRLQRTVDLLLSGDWSSLDIKELHGLSGFYRCRVGKMRIIVHKGTAGIDVVDLDVRGSVYRRLKR